MEQNIFKNVKQLNNIPTIDIVQLTDMSKMFADVGVPLKVEEKNKNIDDDFAIKYSEDLKLTKRIRNFFKNKNNYMGS